MLHWTNGRTNTWKGYDADTFSIASLKILHLKRENEFSGEGKSISDSRRSKKKGFDVVERTNGGRNHREGK